MVFATHQAQIQKKSIVATPFLTPSLPFSKAKHSNIMDKDIVDIFIPNLIITLNV